MSDPCDLASEQEQYLLDTALHKQREQAGNARRLAPTGTCYNPLCSDDLLDGRIFCGSACANEYQKYLGAG